MSLTGDIARAKGIHDHRTKKLGLRPRLIEQPHLKLSSILRRRLPGHPIAVDHLSPPQDGKGGLDFGLYRNDAFGICGPTGVANDRRLVTRWLTGTEQRPTQEEVEDLYRRSGNPDFDPATDGDDNGVNMQTMLDALLQGGIGGVKPVAFARVDVRQTEEVRAAVAWFGGVLFGLTLEIAQQTQEGAWSYKPSGIWGGHAVLCGAYDRRASLGDLKVISWAETFLLTRGFASRQLDEAWVVVWPEMLGSREFLEGVDVDLLRAAYREITGRALP